MKIKTEAKMKDSNKRYEYIDMLKAVGIILMLLGHIQFGKCFDVYIHSFHMPVFFIMSGFLFNPDRNQNAILFVKRKMKSLLIPYCLWGILYEFVGGVLHIGTVKSFIWNNVYEVPIGGAIWFLTALFFAEVFGYIIIKCENPVPGIIIAFVIAILIPALGIHLPFSMDSALVGTVFFLIGYYGKGNIISLCRFIKSRKMYLFFVFALLILYSLAVASYTDAVSMRNITYNHVWSFYLNAVVLSLLWFLVCYELDNRFHNVRVLHGIRYIGKNSITYLCLNQFFIHCIDKIAAKVIGKEYTVMIIYKIIEFFLLLGLCFFINEIFDRSFLRIFKGRISQNN